MLAHIDTDSSRSLINNRLAYVSISRASDDARVYTNNAETLGERLSSHIEKTAAVEPLNRTGEPILKDLGLEHQNQNPLSQVSPKTPALPALPEIDIEQFSIGL